MSMTLWYGWMCVSEMVAYDPLNRALTTDIAVLSILPQEALYLSDKCSSFLVVLYATRPIIFPSGYEHLLGVRGHGAIDVLLTLDVQACWCLSALTCWRRTSLDCGKWRRCEGNVDA